MEDFTTYVEVDPNSHITVTATRVSGTLDRNESAYVYKDKGAGHFNGDFEHLFTLKTISTGQDVNSLEFIWAISNTIGSANTWEDHTVTILSQCDATYTLYLEILPNYSTYISLAKGTVYYLKVKRVGNDTTLYVYSDAARTNLVASRMLTDASKISAQYIYAISSENDAVSRPFADGYIENLDLQEGLPEVAITFVGVGTAAAKNNASVTPTLPSGLQVGDLMLCSASARGNGTLGTPTGWTQKWQLAHASSGINKIALFHRFYQTGDGNPTVTYTGGASGHTIIAQVCAFRGVDSTNPFDVQGATSSNASQANIGPISGITTGANGKCVIVFGHRADDWTSVDTLSGDGLTWNEIGEPDSTLGNDAGEAWDYAISISGSVVVSAKTFTVTGGVAQTGMGVMQSLNEEVVVPSGWRKLQYFTEPPTTGAFNKLRCASEPPVAGAWNKLLYDGE